MPTLVTDTIWQQRLQQINPHIQTIDLPGPSNGGHNLDQDEEWCDIVVDGRRRRIRFHDYDQIYRIPGFYELLFYDRLACCSPTVVVDMLEDVATDFGVDPSDFRVLDVGAGNGMVGDELSERGVETLIGVDVIPEARNAALRDRPDLYDDYLVTDLTALSERDLTALQEADLNCMTTVAALGYGDIPPRAFLQALSVVNTPGWLAFNLKEDFLRDDDTSGFSKLIHRLSREEIIQIQCYRRYRHRVSVEGCPLYYVAMVAKKLKPVPETLLPRQNGHSA